MFNKLKQFFTTRSIPNGGTVPSIYGFSSANTNTGLSVNVDTALKCSVALACIKVISESVASLPLHLYERLDGGGKVRASGHPLYNLIHDVPNPEQTRYEFFELATGHVMTHGNSYIEIERNRAGMPLALWAFHPANMTVSRKDGNLIYTYKHGNEKFILTPDQVMHWKAFGTNGLVGLSPIALAAEAIGLAKATEQFEAEFFRNGAVNGKTLQFPANIGKEKKLEIIEQFTKAYTGLSRAHRLAILDAGSELKESGIPPKDAQFLELRQFQVADIARAFRIPLHMVGDLTRSTNNNIEHQSLEFVVHTLRPWLVRIEQSLSRSLLKPEERGKYFFEFAVDGLLRGDIKSRYEAYAIARNNGWLSADEIREYENLNPLPDGAGKVYLQPLNMAPVEPTTKDSAKRETPEPETRTAEARELRVKNRHRVQRSFAPVIEDAVARIVRREAVDVQKLVKKHLGQRDGTTLLNTLKDFYEQDHREFVNKNMRPVISALASAILTDLEDEFGKQFGNTREYQRFVEDYITTYGKRYTGSSYGQLKQVIEQAIADAEDPAERVDQRLEEWKERRPGKEGDSESTRIANAIARTVFGLAGVTKLVWRNVGDACPLCKSLDGKVVGIDAPFLSEGDSINDFKVDRKVMHSPLHRGCACVIAHA